eukprot:2168584-Pleurochrysis_carterae.AAC.1
MRARDAGFKLRVDHTAERPLPFMPADRVHENSPADEQHLSAKHALVTYERVVGEAYSCNYFAVWCRYRTTSNTQEKGGDEVGCGARGEGICASSSEMNAHKQLSKASRAKDLFETTPRRAPQRGQRGSKTRMK